MITIFITLVVGWGTEEFEKNVRKGSDKDMLHGYTGTNVEDIPDLGSVIPPVTPNEDDEEKKPEGQIPPPYSIN